MSMRNRKIVQLCVKSVQNGGGIFGGKDLKCDSKCVCC